MSGKLFRLILVLISSISLINAIRVKFVTWNVNDNSRVKKYDDNLVGKLLDLPHKTGQNRTVFDIYAVSFQETCLECKYTHWPRITKTITDSIKRRTGVVFKSAGIIGTRKSKYCENLYCHGMHGTTLMFVLVRQELPIENAFTERVAGCTMEWFGNKEKGIASVGFTLNKLKLCFHGLHLDLRSLKSRQTCISQTITETMGRCDIVFFGGDFNTRPAPKDTVVSKYFQNGHNSTFLRIIKTTDDMAGSKPFSGPVNLLKYIEMKHNLQFSEPFSRQPDFIPTYSIDSLLNCSDKPVCFKPKRFPSWTDRIIFYPQNRVKCGKYDTIRNFGNQSDHLPVFSECKIN